MSSLVIRLVAVAFAGARLGAAQMSSPSVFTGMCDASAAIALDDLRFVVANDEDSVLYLYDSRNPGAPETTLNLARFLGLPGKSPETDVEGAARVGERIYWITSHGRNQKGRRQPTRELIFATEIRRAGDRIELVPSGIPYRDLVTDLGRNPGLRDFRLGDAARLAPKEPDALNIEGLCAQPDGTLLIAFRNPIPGGRALLVPLLNPAALMRGERASLGVPVRLALDGRGIREIVQHEGRYLMVAGSFDGGGRSRLYEWAGPGGAPPKPWEVQFDRFNAEALVLYPGRGWNEIQVLSDDGNRKVGGKPCKDVPDPRDRSFRSVWLRR